MKKRSLRPEHLAQGSRPVDPSAGGAPTPTSSRTTISPAPMVPPAEVIALPEYAPTQAQAQELAYQADALQYPGYYQRAGLRWNLDRISRVRGFRVYEEMLRDDQIVAAIALANAMVKARPWFFGVDDEDEQGEARDFLTENFTRYLKGTVAALLTNMLTARVFGYSFTEKVHVNIQWQGKTCWALGETKLRPPWSFMINVDEWGNVQGLRQRVGPAFVDLDPRRFIHYTWDGHWDPHYGRSGLYGCFEDYNAKRYIKRMWNIALERAAVGFPWVQKLSSMGPADEAKLAAALAGMSTEAYLITGANVKVEWIHPVLNGELYDKRLQACDKAIAKALLQPSHTGFAEAQAQGANAQARAHGDTYHDIITAVCTELAAVINEQVVPELVFWNFGPDVTPPQFTFDDLDDGMKMQFATAWAAVKAGSMVRWTAEDEKATRQMIKMTDYSEPDVGDNPADAATPDPYNPGKALDGSPLPPQAPVGPDGKPVPQQVVKPAGPQGKGGEPISPVANASKAVHAALDSGEADTDDLGKPGRTSFGSRFDHAAVGAAYRVLDDRWAARATAAVRLLARQLARDPRETTVTADQLATLKRVARDAIASARVAGAQSARADLRRLGRHTFAEPAYTAPELVDILAYNWAQNLGEDVASVVRTVWAAGLHQQLSEAQIAANIQAALAPFIGDDPTSDVATLADAPARLATAVRTTNSTAFTKARRDIFEDPALDGFVEAYENTSILDARTTPYCEYMDGRVYAVDNPVWEQPDVFPPSHYNCRRDVIPLVRGDQWEEDEPPALDPPGF